MDGKNVLLICSDEHARSASGCYGHPLVRTPNLDKLAASGVRFTRAYTPSPICVPARACLATGMHVHENRCWSSSQPFFGQHESWMGRLRDKGHETASVGKLHYRSGEDNNGFCEEILPMYLANRGVGWPQGLVRDPMPGFADSCELARDAGQGETDYTDYDRRISAEACDWIRRHGAASRDKPWALFVSFVSPHYPLVAPGEFYRLYSELPLSALPECGRQQVPDHPVLKDMARFWDYESHFDDETRARAIRAYFGLCSFLDDNVGNVLGALEDSGALNDTVVMYISDHGEMLGRHGFWTKSVMYEDSVGIPLIMAGGGIPVGVNTTPVSLVDIGQTIEHVVGLDDRDNSKDWHGRSLTGFLDTPRPERLVLSEYHDGGSPTGIFMVRYDCWKYVYYAGNNPSQLFDLESDPNELTDLSGSEEHQPVCQRMHEALISMLDPEDVNANAFRDQASLLELLGGRDRVLAMPGFNHTPVGS